MTDSCHRTIIDDIRWVQYSFQSEGLLGVNQRFFEFDSDFNDWIDRQPSDAAIETWENAASAGNQAFRGQRGKCVAIVAATKKRTSSPYNSSSSVYGTRTSRGVNMTHSPETKQSDTSDVIDPRKRSRSVEVVDELHDSTQYSVGYAHGHS